MHQEHEDFEEQQEHEDFVEHEEHPGSEELQLPPVALMHTQAGLDVLCNQDLLKLLFEKLDRLALCSAGATCRQWRQVAASDEFWTSLDFSGLGISSWQVACCTYWVFSAAALLLVCTSTVRQPGIHVRFASRPPA